VAIISLRCSLGGSIGFTSTGSMCFPWLATTVVVFVIKKVMTLKLSFFDNFFDLLHGSFFYLRDMRPTHTKSISNLLLSHVSFR
jgi:hypothetical protein